MKKQNIKKQLDSNCFYELDGLTLRKAADYFIKRSEQYEAEGYHDISFETYTDHDGDACMMINGSRLETDDEAIARAVREVRIEKEARERDLQAFKATAERLGINVEGIKEL
jgi:hypothetical protein